MKLAQKHSIVFVNRFFYPDHSATSQLLSDLAFDLADAGHNVTVITSRFASGRAVRKSETINGVRIVRTVATQLGRRSLAGRILDYATFYASASIALVCNLKRNDIVVAKTDPPGIGIVVALAARWKKANFVNWFQDIFPEVATETKVGSGLIWRLLAEVLIFLRARSIALAAQNVVVGEAMQQRIQIRLSRPAKLFVITNWSDGDAIVPVAPSENRLRHRFNQPGSFLVGYSGNLGRAHEIATIQGAIMSLGRAGVAGKRLDWLFIGGGTGYEKLKEFATGRALDNVHFWPHQPRDTLAESLSLPDVHLVSLRPELTGWVVPSKYYGIAAAGRPTIFIGSSDCEIAMHVQEAESGVVVSAGDSRALADEIVRLARSPELVRELGANARRDFERKFDRKLAVQSWIKLLDGVAENSTAGARPQSYNIIGGRTPDYR